MPSGQLVEVPGLPGAGVWECPALQSHPWSGQDVAKVHLGLAPLGFLPFLSKELQPRWTNPI